MRKVIEDGYVKVVLAADGNWYTRHKISELLFLPELVQLVEHESYKNLTITTYIDYLQHNYTRLDYVKRKELVSDLLYGMGYKLTDDQLQYAGYLITAQVQQDSSFIVDTTLDEYTCECEYILELNNYEVFVA